MHWKAIRMWKLDRCADGESAVFKMVIWAGIIGRMTLEERLGGDEWVSHLDTQSGGGDDPDRGHSKKISVTGTKQVTGRMVGYRIRKAKGTDHAGCVVHGRIWSLLEVRWAAILGMM